MGTRPKIVVLGILTRYPVAGVVWQTAHYLAGFERLGFEAYYVEAHAVAPGKFITEDGDDGAAGAAAYIADFARRFGLGDRWAFHALHSDGRCHGMDHARLLDVYRSAALVVNLSGATRPLPEHAAGCRLVFLETDPVRLQVELHDGVPQAAEFLRPHAAFFTFGENYGRPGCGLPVSAEFNFRPTRQPVVLDFWPAGGTDAGRYTTVGNWNQDRLGRNVVYRGEEYTWSKHHEFLKVLDLPRRTGRAFELALALGRLGDPDRRLLEEEGWGVRDAADLSADPDRYRDYVRSSRGEFTVAKDQNVRLRSGWFSDRSACYLAAGRPVVTQETGFRDFLPTGEGLFGFTTVDEAADAVARIEADYARHSRAAARVALECFDSDVVLGSLVRAMGLRPGGGRAIPTGGPAASGFPESLALTPVSRWPTRLPAETETVVHATPIPAGPAGPPEVSIVVVTHGGLTFTRLCLETLLAVTDGPRFEVVVVDNASPDGTAAYLAALAAEHPTLRPVFNPGNRGFAAANNQGLALARGRVLVLLNNDTIPTRGWLGGLLRYLDDPAVGLVGPVTNRCGNEAQVEAAYRTLGELAAFAAGRDAAGAFDIRMLAMYCVAMRREVFDRAGPLDERFGVGLFEDDDYALRVRAAGYRVVCAEDVFVHHFGQASLGGLAADGEYGRLFHANRRRWEEKWLMKWHPYERRRTAEYRALVDRVRRTVEEVVPADATVLVVSRGDDDLLDLGGRRAWHFPRAANGVYAGHHPADSQEAIDRLEEVRALGAEYFVIPDSSAWWLEHYDGFARHLRECCPVAVAREGCQIFRLAPWRAVPANVRLSGRELS